jgi:hypothetical protein
MAKFLDLLALVYMDRTQLHPKHDATNSMAPNCLDRLSLTLFEAPYLGSPVHPLGVMTARPLILPPWSS